MMTSRAQMHDVADLGGGAPVTGFIPETVIGDRGVPLWLNDYSRDDLDDARLAYFEEYARLNFADGIAPNQGLDEILKSISELPSADGWLDLGAGTSTYFWACALQQVPRSVVCADVVPEALYLLRDISQRQMTTRTYAEAAVLCGFETTRLDEIWRMAARFAVFDFSRTWPEDFEAKTFDLITAIGSFGLSNTIRSFAGAAASASHHLRNNGSLFGVNWLRTEGAIDRLGYDTSHLTPEAISDSLCNAGLSDPSVEIVPIKDPQKLYAAIAIWSGRKP